MTTQVNGNGTAPAPTFTEAPASATARVISPVTGLEWMLTTRAATTRELLGQVRTLETWLIENGWHAAPARAEAAHNGNGQAAQGDAPLCPTHGKPMKQGKGGGWYCPVKLLEDDGTGKPVYCKQRK